MIFSDIAGADDILRPLTFAYEGCLMKEESMTDGSTNRPPDVAALLTGGRRRFIPSSVRLAVIGFVSLAFVLMLAAGEPMAGKRQGVSIEDMKYSPATLRIAKGDTVVWTNNDDRDHTVVADDGAFDSGTIARGESFKHKFDRSGKYPYACELHPRMKGSIVVGE